MILALAKLNATSDYIKNKKCFQFVKSYDITVLNVDLIWAIQNFYGCQFIIRSTTRLKQQK